MLALQCCARFTSRGTYIATYSLYNHASSRQWSIARNAFYRPVMPPSAEDKDNGNWQFCETITTDSPHSYNMCGNFDINSSISP